MDDSAKLELLVAMGDALADIKARLETVEGAIIRAGLISREDFLKEAATRYDACNPIKMSMDAEFGPRETTEEK